MGYSFSEIEKKWQDTWKETKLYETTPKKKQKKQYILDMFPYPSGEGLHVGHPKGYVATDVLSRYYRMQGYHVLHPMGFDAFGLPAENFAIKKKIHPKEAVSKNIERFKEQLNRIGFSYDWSREIDTTDPSYYKWTQWIFLKLFERGLAYEASLPINWCPKDKTGLANEEVIEGKCERCGTPVEKKTLRQWVLKITEYADRLLEDLEGLDWPESIIRMQRNWIGRSQGAIVSFSTEKESVLSIFTTRLDTLLGVTYLVIAPEHPLLSSLTTSQQKEAVETYVQEAKQKTDLQRTELHKEKTGIFSGSYAIHPLTQEKIPIWISDYVLGFYGTGAVMAVPAHDVRDYAFAKKYDLPIKTVIVPASGDRKEPFVEEGVLMNCGKFDGMTSLEAKEAILKALKKSGEKKIQYKLRDWLFSRQRYWGEPIPIIHCEKCGIVPVPEKDLPVLLPDVKSYEPTGTGESPLASIPEFVNTTCPSCGGPGKRETNTMPQWAGSCWYYLRFIDPHNDQEFADKKLLKYYLPVDCYVGGAEHAVLHLLYARFWHKVLYDERLVPTKEPFQKLRNVGLIMADDGRKMSKSLGNVINPDDIINEYGADAFRMYEMFIGPFEQSAAWNTNGVSGVAKFLTRFEKYISAPSGVTTKEIRPIIEKTIKKVGEDIIHMQYNTAVSSLMILMNALEEAPHIDAQDKQRIVQILAPFAPHLSEELWERLGQTYSILDSAWPSFDEKALVDSHIEMVCMVNGKPRTTILVKRGLPQEDIESMARMDTALRGFLEGKEIKKIVFKQDKIINFVV